MSHSFVSTIALTLALATPTLAQDILPQMATELERSGIAAPTIMSSGYAHSEADTLVTQLLDKTVFTSIADDAGQIGTIEDLVVTPGFGISAVVISVGGFLGVGAKDVAVDFAQLEWAQREDGTRRWVLPTTADELTSAPAFIWADSEEVTGEPALTPSEEQAQLVDGDPNQTAIDPALTTDQPEREDETTLDRAGISPFDSTGLSAEDMLGIAVYGINDEQIGTIGDVVRNADDSLDAVIVDVGGFLGLGAKPVAVGYENLTFSADTLENRYLFLNTTREQLEAQTAYDPDTYSADRASQRMIVTP
ncbi:PRC-barrel domain-containing protein [Devosia neptuniae]|jgi:sporulation protein YlmC with PRC-barrel domain|uniref:PRC-barrel domain-containing protein n=1 Tax=Devosia TaxID=46913 RepID=UPI0022B05F8F|nr:PRC-barrel domain-containing protein [Devosia neptuniae]MCZ4346657.1 PRC-barrel domain-containing protein [Devosia neptuniae]|tara:strand:+ start:1066 stop:1986 length:921 start_codon:yes stop_codon:yes gene_type:complete